jgi:hypothetical protein
MYDDTSFSLANLRSVVTSVAFTSFFVAASPSPFSQKRSTHPIPPHCTDLPLVILRFPAYQSISRSYTFLLDQGSVRFGAMRPAPTAFYRAANSHLGSKHPTCSPHRVADSTAGLEKLQLEQWIKHRPVDHGLYLANGNGWFRDLGMGNW